MAHTPPPEPESRLVVVRGSRANVPDHETPNRTRANPFVLEARTAAARCQSARCSHRDTGPREKYAWGVLRWPAEDGGVGAPPPAGRAERRQHLDLLLIRVSAHGFVSAGSHLPPARTTYRWRRYEPLGSDGMWTKRGPSPSRRQAAGPVPSRTPLPLRSSATRDRIGQPGAARPIATVDSLCQSSLRTPRRGTPRSWQRTRRR
jgi:hypothetical protein